MSDSPENYQDSMLARHMPVVGMLLADTTALDEVVSYSDISPLRRILISFLARILYSQLQKYGGASGANMTSAMNLLMVSDPDDITPSLLEALRRPLPDIYAYVSSPKRISYVMTLGLAQGLVATELHALQMFVHYFIYWSISLGGVLLRDVAGGGDLTIDIFTTELIKDSSGVTVRGNGFEWLAFVLNEIYFLISYDEYGSVTRTPESLSTALDFVVKTVLFLLEYDHDHDVARHRLDIVDYQHDRKKCSSLCRFSTAIIDILYLIREHYPRTAFMLTAVWHDLASRLDILSAELGHHYSPGGRHRDRVKQNIRVAFRCFTPENPRTHSSFPQSVAACMPINAAFSPQMSIYMGKRHKTRPGGQTSALLEHSQRIHQAQVALDLGLHLDRLLTRTRKPDRTCSSPTMFLLCLQLRIGVHQVYRDLRMTSLCFPDRFQIMKRH